jgi:hypothetical protein
LNQAYSSNQGGFINYFKIIENFIKFIIFDKRDGEKESSKKTDYIEESRNQLSVWVKLI